MIVCPEARPFPVSVGQHIVLYPVGNFNRSREMRCYPAVVESIGRKYFTAKRADVNTEVQLTKEYCVSKDYVDFGQGYFAYESEAALEREYDLARKWALIRAFVQRHHSYQTVPAKVIDAMYDVLPTGEASKLAKLEGITD